MQTEIDPRGVPFIKCPRGAWATEDPVFHKPESRYSFERSLKSSLERRGMQVPDGNVLMFRPSPFFRANYGEIMHELYHCGEDMPEMFEDGVVLRLKVLNSPEYDAFDAAAAMQYIINQHEDLTRQFLILEKHTSRQMEHYGATEYELTPYAVEVPTLNSPIAELFCVLDVMLIDDDLNRKGMQFLVGPIGDTLQDAFCASLKKHLRGQRQRRAGGEDHEIQVDVITAQQLKTMTSTDLLALIDYVMSDRIPKNAVDAQKDYDRYRWAKKRAFVWPEALTRMHLKDGLLRTKIELGQDATLTDSIISVEGAPLPETVRASVAGREAREIVDHPWMPEGAKIRNITMNGSRMHVRLDLPTVSLLSITPEPPTEDVSTKKRESMRIAQTRRALRNTAEAAATSERAWPDDNPIW